MPTTHQVTLFAVNVLLSLFGSWSSISSAFRSAVGLAMTSVYAFVLFSEAHFYDYGLERVLWLCMGVEIAHGHGSGGSLEPVGIRAGNVDVS